MLKSILVPLVGLQYEEAIFDTALAIARPLRCHIDFYRMRFSASHVAVRSLAAGFCLGEATRDLLDQITERNQDLSVATNRLFGNFCQLNGITACASTLRRAADSISARLIEADRSSDSELLIRCRHSDLIVLGRPTRINPQLENLAELLLLNSGHPVLIAPVSGGRREFATVVIAMQSNAASARAVSAAIPLLQVAKQVHLIALEDSSEQACEAIANEARHLSWHGVRVAARVIHCQGRNSADDLLCAASDLGADLLVAGAYDHRPMLDALLGGLTRALLQRSDLPLLLTH